MKLIAIGMAKLAGWLLEKRHRGGSFPGKVALRIYPDIMTKLTYNATVIIVSGTNGKTSTANMIASSLQAANKKVIHNQKGDNLKYGIVTTLVMNCTLSGKIHSDMIVLEVDELSMPYVMSHIKANVVVLTNFFRDQLDRAKEMEQLIQTVEDALKNFTGNLILNGNDPNVVRFAYAIKQANPHFYGLEQVQSVDASEVQEGAFCPLCGKRLQYHTHQYSHIGNFFCEHCEFRTPDQIHVAHNIIDHSFYYGDDCYYAPIDANYMIYNCMAVLTLFTVLNLSKASVKQAFQSFKMPDGRNEHFEYQNQKITLNLIKNPTGTNEVLKQIQKDKDDKIIVFLLNDHEQDGTDISWIYDSNFEYVFQASTISIICCGERAYEAALRMKYGGYTGELQVEENKEMALRQALKKGKHCYVLSTYTGLFLMRSIIKKVIS